MWIVIICNLNIWPSLLVNYMHQVKMFTSMLRAMNRLKTTPHAKYKNLYQTCNFSIDQYPTEGRLFKSLLSSKTLDYSSEHK